MAECKETGPEATVEALGMESNEDRGKQASIASLPLNMPHPFPLNMLLTSGKVRGYGLQFAHELFMSKVRGYWLQFAHELFMSC